MTAIASERVEELKLLREIVEHANEAGGLSAWATTQILAILDDYEKSLPALEDYRKICEQGVGVDLAFAARMKFMEAQLEKQRPLIESSGEEQRGSLRSEVAAFAAIMEAELRKHDDRPGWKECDPAWLMDRLRQEFRELQWAIETTFQENITHEAADVANFAMMVADVYGGLGQARPAPADEERREIFPATMTDEKALENLWTLIEYAIKNQGDYFTDMTQAATDAHWHIRRRLVGLILAPPVRVSEDEIDAVLKDAVGTLIQNCSVVCEDAGLCSMEVKERIIALLREKGIIVGDKP